VFSLKIFNKKDNRTSEFKRTVETIFKYLNFDLNRETKVVSDNRCIEIIAGSSDSMDSGGIVTELLIKKTLFINNSDLEDRDRLDQYLSEIRSFCENADKIESVTYMPLQMRELK